jgi:hypothetical protein
MSNTATNPARDITDTTGPRNRLPLSDDQLRQLVDKICQSGDDAAINALLLLTDEFEASQFDRLRIDGMCFTISQQAFSKSGTCDEARHGTVTLLRDDLLEMARIASVRRDDASQT